MTKHSTLAPRQTPPCPSQRAQKRPGTEGQRETLLWVCYIKFLGWLPTNERILQTGFDVKRAGYESYWIHTISPINRHGKMKRTYKNDHEDTDDHHRHIAGTLHGLASHCHAAIYRHHHRERIALFPPEVSHRIQRRPHQMGQSHSY